MLRSLQIERESEDDAQPAAPPQWMWLAGVGMLKLPERTAAPGTGELVVAPRRIRVPS
jgi:hypothetical protein